MLATSKNLKFEATKIAKPVITHGSSMDKAEPRKSTEIIVSGEELNNFIQDSNRVRRKQQPKSKATKLDPFYYHN